MKEDIKLEDYIFSPLMEVIKRPEVSRHMRECPVFSDEVFLKSGVGRTLEVVMSGREWVQKMQQQDDSEVSSADYFTNLRSSRRLDFVAAAYDAMKTQYLPKLRMGADRLADIKELNGIEVWSADGHAIQHACHDKRRECSDGIKRYLETRQIFGSDMRSGWILPIALCRGTEHELNTLKNVGLEVFLESVHGPALFIYDRAVIDVAMWNKLLKDNDLAIISRTKAGMRPIYALPRAWDQTDPRNCGVIADENVGFNNLGELRRVTYIDPESNELFEFLTSEFNLAPGIIAMLYQRRWDIEKVFDEFENKLSEKKAWATTNNAKVLQCYFTALAYNLLLLLDSNIEAEYKIREIKPALKYQRWLEVRTKVAEAAGRSINYFAQSVRVTTQHTLQFIRWIRNHIRSKKELAESLIDLPMYLFGYI